MTLAQFYDYLSAHPLLTLAFFTFPPVAAGFVAWLGRGRGFESPWRQVYAVLVFWVSVPGIFAFTLMAYLFLFERQSVWSVDLLTQVVPLLSMVATLYLVQRNVDLAYVPGFGRLSGLLGIIFALLFFMYVSQHFRWITFTYLPASTVLIGFALVLLLALWGARRVSGAGGRERRAPGQG